VAKRARPALSVQPEAVDCWEVSAVAAGQAAAAATSARAARREAAEAAVVQEEQPVVGHPWVAMAVLEARAAKEPLARRVAAAALERLATLARISGPDSRFRVEEGEDRAAPGVKAAAVVVDAAAAVAAVVAAAAET
jgi:hypothetical protein